MKATYGEITHKCKCEELNINIWDCENYDGEDKCKKSIIEPREIFKDPITDDGTKKSKKGLLKVHTVTKNLKDSQLVVQDRCTWEEEKTGELTTVFKDGKLIRETTLDEIRERISKTL